MRRSLIALVFAPLLLAGCNSNPGASASAAATIAAGTDAIDAYLAPFIKTSQDSCFGAVALGGTTFAAPGDAMFAGDVSPTRVVIAVDGSGSMAARLGERTKLELARAATLAFISDLPPAVPASLIVFGQRGDNSARGKPLSCDGIDTLTAMTTDRAKLSGAAGTIRAVGWTPLAAALKRAQADLSANAAPGSQVIYVVSDGQETCGGDPVAVAKAIYTGGTRAIVNIIGFDLPAADAAALQAVAAAGGGKLINVGDAGQFDRVLAGIRESMRRSDNRVAASNARAENSIRTGAAASDATICTGQLITAETTAVGADLTRREAKGEPIPDRSAVFARLEQRHQAMRERRDAYVAARRAKRDAAVVTIDRAAEDANR